MSEFSLVIASLGLSLGHIDARTVAVLTFVFVITSVASTYMIAMNHELQARLAGWARRLGLRDGEKGEAGADASGAAAIVFLGFYRDASSIVHQFEMEAKGSTDDALLGQMLVVDFNPQVLAELPRRGIRCVYGDVSSMDTLHHAAVPPASSSVPSPIPSSRGRVTRGCPAARRQCGGRPVVASETIEARSPSTRGRGSCIRACIPRIMAEVCARPSDGLEMARVEEMAAYVSGTRCWRNIRVASLRSALWLSPVFGSTTARRS
jgi:hypothetical protein